MAPSHARTFQALGHEGGGQAVLTFRSLVQSDRFYDLYSKLADFSGEVESLLINGASAINCCYPALISF